MRVPRVFVDMDLNVDDEMELPSPQSKYLLKVLRMDVGRELCLLNGQGGEYRGKISWIGSKQVCRAKLSTFTSENRMPPLRMELRVALSRGDKFDFIVQKATELGVFAIHPIISERTEVKMNLRKLSKKMAHWRSIAISASEQSRRNQIPVIYEPKRLLGSHLNTDNLDTIVLHTVGGISLKNTTPPDNGLALYIGPEGGFSEVEISYLRDLGAQIVSLGDRVLRMETAPVAILGAINCLWGDW